MGKVRAKTKKPKVKSTSQRNKEKTKIRNKLPKIILLLKVYFKASIFGVRVKLRGNLNNKSFLKG